MASGYEKAACGVDPNEGWGRPSRLENAVQWIVVFLAVALLLIIPCWVIALLLS